MCDELLSLTLLPCAVTLCGDPVWAVRQEVAQQLGWALQGLVGGGGVYSMVHGAHSVGHTAAAGKRAAYAVLDTVLGLLVASGGGEVAAVDGGGGLRGGREGPSSAAAAAGSYQQRVRCFAGACNAFYRGQEIKAMEQGRSSNRLCAEPPLLCRLNLALAGMGGIVMDASRDGSSLECREEGEGVQEVARRLAEQLRVDVETAMRG